MRGARFERRRVLPVRAHIEPDAAMRLCQARRRNPAVLMRPSTTTLPLSWTRGASGASASRASTTAGNSSISISTRSAMSSASAARRCIDGGDRLADKTHHVFRQKRLLDRPVAEFVQHRPDRPRAGKLRSGDDAGAGRRADAHDASRGNRAAHEAQMMYGGKIGGETPAPGHQRRVFQPPDGAADPFHSRAGGCGCHGGKCIRNAAARPRRPA